MIDTLRRLARGDLQPQPQDPTLATLAPMLKKEDGRIDWALKAEEIWWRVRGLRPWPGAYTTFRGQNLHIWAAARPTAAEPSLLEPGTLAADHGRLLVACGQGTLLEVLEVQREGRKRLSGREFLNGVRLASGEKLD
jgi:methionyl-tRNA formyltransferase